MQVSKNVIHYFNKEAKEMMRIQFLAIFQCAPVLNQVKPSVLFSAKEQEAQAVTDFLIASGIKVKQIGHRSGRKLLFCYRPEPLTEMLGEKCRRDFLDKAGYDKTDSPEHVLALWEKRVEKYEAGNGGFPHETGIFLGYPVGDVQGFAAKDGKCAADTDYWKVYENLLQARLTFSLYDKAKIFSVNRFLSGKMIEEREML